MSIAAPKDHLGYVMLSDPFLSSENSLVVVDVGHSFRNSNCHNIIINIMNIFLSRSVCIWTFVNEEEVFSDA